MNLDFWANKNILITGHTGFKGAWLCNWLFLLGSKVVGVGLKPEKDSIIFRSLNLISLFHPYKYLVPIHCLKDGLIFHDLEYVC